MIVRRLHIAAVALGVTVATQAIAGSADRYDIIGFSASRDRFFFEVFGTFDALGGGRSIIYAIDTRTDSWVTGTPFETVIGDGNPELDTIDLQEIRSRTMAKALPMIEAGGPIDPGYTVAARAFGQIGVPSDQLAWRMPAYGNLPYLVQPPYVLDLEAFVAGQDDFFGDCLGYVLRLNGTEVHRDVALPASRGCPLRYELDEVVCQYATCVALIAVYDYGFEGWDRSYIATAFAVDPY